MPSSVPKVHTGDLLHQRYNSPATFIIVLSTNNAWHPTEYFLSYPGLHLCFRFDICEDNLEVE